jgi:hypothetical protein
MLESRIPRLPQRFVLYSSSDKEKGNYPLDLSSFNRNGIEPSLSSNSSSQAPHHMMRASARENTKSASLSAQQQPPRIQEKLKCVLFLLIFSKDYINSSCFFLSSVYNKFRKKKHFFYSFEISDLEKHRQLHHHQQIAIQVRFEFIRVNIIHQQSSKKRIKQGQSIDMILKD